MNRILSSVSRLSLTFTLAATAAGCGILFDAPAKTPPPAVVEEPKESQAAAMIRTLTASSCEAYPAAFDKDFYCCHESTPAEALPVNIAAARKFAACNQWSELFDRLSAFKGYAGRVLSALDSDTPVVPKFIEVVATLYKFDKPDPAAEQLATWLVETKGAAECKAIVPHNKDIAEAVMPRFAWFHFVAGCGESVLPFARAGLAHDDFHRRVQACDILGKYGVKADIAKVELLAKHDPHYVEGYVNNAGTFVRGSYPVRERCEQAGTKLRLR